MVIWAGQSEGWVLYSGTGCQFVPNNSKNNRYRTVETNDSLLTEEKYILQCKNNMGQGK